MQNSSIDGELTLIEPHLDFDTLVENFELLDDWEDRYRYIIDLGRKLPPFPDSAKTDSVKVRGCMSQVWMIPAQVPDHPGQFAFAADSDAHIVKGLIYVLAILYTGKTASEISEVDADMAFGQLGLDQHLSPSRRNGLVSMVGRIQEAGKGQSDAV